ncbi:MAG: serine/threonine-protein kinase [Candidatus Sulfomarinibacteraceae bacterium]
MTLSQGDRLGRYEILGPIGAGGMGEVWRARDTELDREVAVKVLPEEVASEPRRVERFRREARALAALSHPNLLEVHDVGSIDGLNFVVTELLEGDSLRAAIPPSGLPWKKVAEIGAAAAEGLAAAHGRGIIHRDLKPENLFLTADGRVKILDFGLASMDDEPGVDGNSPTVTEDGAVLGTAGYMAPEQLRGRPATAQSDIFSLGCVIYEMASGRRAFSGNTGAELYAAILKEEPPQLSSSGATVPVDLERIVHRCLEKRPEARSQSAADLAHSLKSLGSSPSARVMATPSGARSIDGRRWGWWQIAVAALLLVVAAGIAWWTLVQPRQKAGTGPVRGGLNPNRIAVVPFANRTGDPDLDRLGTRAVDRITQQLAVLEDLDVVPASRVAAALADDSAGPRDPRGMVADIASATSAGLVLTGVIDPLGDRVELLATLEDAISRRVLRVFDPLVAEPAEAESALATLAEWSTIATNDHLHPSLAFGAGDGLPDFETYQRFVRELAQFDRTHVAGMFSLLDEEPGFTRVRLFLTAAMLDNGRRRAAGQFLDSEYVKEADLNRHQAAVVRGLRSWIAGDWDLAFRLFRDELTANPSNLALQHVAIRCGLRANRPAAVIDIYGGFEWDPAVPAALMILLTTDTANAYHLLGRYDDEVRVLEDLWGDLPPSIMTDWGLMRYAIALGARGDLDRINELLDQNTRELGPCNWTRARVQAAHELRAHGHTEASVAVVQPLLADTTPEIGESLGTDCPWWNEAVVEALLISGRNHEAAERCRRFSIEVEGWRAAMLFPGIAAARLGKIDLAKRGETDLAELPEDAVGLGASTLGRAMIFAQLGDKARAMELVRQAVAEGLPVPNLHGDVFLEPLWDDPGFREIVRPKG